MEGIETKGKVFTAPKAYILIEGKLAGYCRNLSFSENVTRANVQGLGSLTLQEAPAVLYTCQWSVSHYFLNFETPVMREMLFKHGSVGNIVNSLILGDMNFDLTIYSKTLNGGIDTKPIKGELVTTVTDTGYTIAQLKGCMVNTQSFQLQEGGIAGTDVTGVYLNPITLG